MSQRPVIVFAFWGRRANVALQLPYIRRILAEHPNVEFHGWNLANTLADDSYLRTIPNGERFTIRHDFASPRAQKWINRVWQYYTAKVFGQTLFVKLDDDVLFLQTDGFGRFLDVVEANPDTVLSALTVNNGASTRLLPPDMWGGFLKLDIPLLDVHASNEYAALAHDFFFDNWRDLLTDSTAVIPTEDWLSINCIGMTWRCLVQAATVLGRRSPHLIAGRKWHPSTRIGDEGAINLQRRAIFPGFTVSHLGFGPQKLTDPQTAAWRQRYADIADDYLAYEAVFRN